MIAALSPLPAMATPQGCYASTFDAAHLAAHPDQVVQTLALYFTPDANREGVARVELRAVMARQGHAARRGVGGAGLEEFGLCDPEGTCVIACDGGMFRILSADTEAVEIETSHARVSAQPCTPGMPISTLADVPGEITTYRLTRAPESACGR
ncbi:hypothetical protein HKCCSP123_07090 [Rhodobacterales bacterium HKCCSP123]|nr:hypothetical protein [Rhodobacterales bacterium HKCCSP123]